MILLCLLAIFAITVSLFFFNFRRYKELMRVPGPSYFFIFATTFYVKLTSVDAFKNLINLNHKYGPVVKLWMNPLKPMLIVSDPEYVKHLLSSNVHLDKSKFYELFHAVTGNGLGTVESSKWKIQRKLLNHGFRGKTIENYAATMDKLGNELITNLAKDINQCVDVYPILSMYSLQVLCATILNLKENFDVETYLEYLKARNEFLSLLPERMVSLLKRNDCLYRFMDTKEIHRRSVNVFKNFTKKIIAAYLKQSSSGGHLIDYLFEGDNPEDPSLSNNIRTFLIAGGDVMASVLSFTLYELGKHKDIQVKIVEESNSVVPGANKDAEFTFGQLQQMKYLECVLKESMRKYTPVPFFDRRTGEEMVIDGFRIPKGIEISICAYNIHHNEEYFPDPENFLPDRFSSENEEDIKPYTYIPFSLGPRGCIGKQFGMMQMKLTLAKILRHYEIHVADAAQKMELKSEFVLRSTIGMPVKLTLRNS